MDFGTSYSQEQESFRTMVRGWLMENAPKDMRIPLEMGLLEPAVQERIRKFRRELGAKGWLAPTWPRELGGGGLSSDMGIVIEEELQALRMPNLGDNRRHTNMLLAWGNETQKRRYVLPALRGELITWQSFSEPAAGADLAGIKTQAVAHGEDYLINGIKTFISVTTGRLYPDYLLTLAVTDPTRPRNYNLGVFMVDARLPGVSIVPQKILSGSENNIYMNDVLVPGDCLIGGLYQGWEIAQTILEQERGELVLRMPDEGTVDSVQRYLREQRDPS